MSKGPFPQIVHSPVQKANQETKVFQGRGVLLRRWQALRTFGSLEEVSWASLEVREGFQEEVASET